MLPRLSLALLVLTLLTIPAAHASPGPPWVSAARSTNGRFLVITEYRYDDPNPRVARHLLASTYRVLELEPFLNSKDTLSTPLQMYSQGSSWEFTIDYKENPVAFWPLISNDGQSVVLLGVTPAISGQPVLRIYRRQQYSGALVRAFQIDDLWTPRQINPTGGPRMITDATPQWFAGGSFSFSSDDKSLLYETQWHDHLAIRLADGVLTRESK